MSVRLTCKKIIIIMLSITINITSAGCSNKVDIQQLSIIMAMGVDMTPEGRYRVSYQILKSGSEPQANGDFSSEAKNAAFLYFEGTGDTVYDAMFSMSDRTSKKLLFGQMKILVLSPKTAEKGISPIMDVMGRMSEVKANLPVYVTSGEASSVIKQRSPEDAIAANVLEDLMVKHLTNGNQPVGYMAYVIDRLNSDYSSPVLGVVDITDKSREPGDSTFKMNGMAVFNGDKLVGLLSEKMALGRQYVTDKVKSVTSVVKLPDGPKISIEVESSKSRIETKIKNGRVRVTININQQGAVREFLGKVNTVKDPKILEVIGRQQEKAVKSSVSALIDAAQKDLKKDILDIGANIYRHHPKEWQKIKDRWSEVFMDTDFKVNVSCNIKSTGLLSEPVK